jgi:pimeloyl-ACP methyl ester carboxylesterase
MVPVLPLHGARAVGPRSGDFFLDGRLVETRHALCQSVWELRRLVAWARAQAAPSVGVYGISLGALCAALLASVETDLDHLLLGMPLCDVADVLWRHAPPDRIERMAGLGLTRARVEEWLRPVTPLARSPKLAGDRVTIFAGTGDRIVPPGQALALQRSWGGPRLEWLEAGHLTFFGPRFRAIEAAALARLHD